MRRGFHSCRFPADLFRTDYPAFGSRFALVRPGGEIIYSSTDSKLVSAELTVEKELTFMELIDHVVQAAVAGQKERIEGFPESVVKHGDSNAASTSAYGAPAITTGFWARSAATGYAAPAVAVGKYSAAVAMGCWATAVSARFATHAVVTNMGGVAASLGNESHAVALGGSAAIAGTTGRRAHAVAVGDNGTACALGAHSIAVAIGQNGKVQADAGAVVLAAFDDRGRLCAVFASMVGENGIVPGNVYKLGIDGRPILVEARK